MDIGHLVSAIHQRIVQPLASSLNTLPTLTATTVSIKKRNKEEKHSYFNFLSAVIALSKPLPSSYITLHCLDPAFDY
jgi:hypothetical protein